MKELRGPDSNGEYPVVYWDSVEGEHYYYEFIDSTTGDQCVADDLVVVAPNFSTYLFDIVMNRIQTEEKRRERRE